MGIVAGIELGYQPNRYLMASLCYEITNL